MSDIKGIYNKTIAYNMKFFRESKGMGQLDLGNLLGIKRSLVGAYEQGRAEPSIYIISEMSKLLKVSIEEFITIDLSEVIRTPEEKTNELANTEIVKKKIDLIKILVKDLQSEVKIKVYMDVLDGI